MSSPKIYTYTTDYHDKLPWEGKRDGTGVLKVGETREQTVQERVRQQTGTAHLPTRILLEMDAVGPEGNFRDHDVHRVLREKGFWNPYGEWFECSALEVESTIVELQKGERYRTPRPKTFGPRLEQDAAIDVAFECFLRGDPCLWNCKMRFGKTFTAYKLIEVLGFEKVLVLSFKVAVKNSWREDLLTHTDFKDFSWIDPSSPAENFLAGGPEAGGTRSTLPFLRRLQGKK